MTDIPPLTIGYQSAPAKAAASAGLDAGEVAP